MSMTTQLYPKLKNTARIKKYPSYCWVMELFAGSGMFANSLDAFILSLCTGEYRTSDITHILAGTFEISEETAAQTVSECLDIMNPCVDLLTVPNSGKVRYQPQSFLYDCRVDKDTMSLRMQTPTEMSFNLTRKCNFRCVYCYNASGIAKQDEMSTGQWLDAVKQAKELEVLKCTLTGGEPMVHPGFFDILGALLRNDILPYICTNGSLIDDRAVSRFADIGTPVVQISLDTPSAEVQDKMTAVNGSFPRVTHAIEALVKAGVTVYVKAVMLPVNYRQVGELIDLCYNAGVRNLILDRFDLSFGGRGSNAFFLSKEQCSYVKTAVEDKRRVIGNKMNINLIQVPQCWSCSDDIVKCGAFLRSFNIMPDGEYVVCEKIDPCYQMSVGNFKTMPIADMWRSPKIEKLMTPPDNLVVEPCRSCEHLSVCNTGCFAAKQFVSDNLYAPDPRCWRSEYENNAYKVER